LKVSVDWSSEDELLGSVSIVDEKGREWLLTAMPQRDAFFNRLVAIGPQRWENL